MNWRSVGLGLLGVVGVCALAPFNDYVLNNSVLIGGSLPIAAVLYVFLISVFVNGPLSRFHRGLTSAEMLLILVMVLVVCCIPTSGLMRFWPASLVGPWNYLNQRPETAKIFTVLELPDWFWPSMGENRPTDPVVTEFYSRIDPSAPWGVWYERWKAWLAPTVGWGVFFLAMGLSVLGLSTICARQWTVNERIPFPVAQVQLSLIQQPSAGKWLHPLLCSRGFVWTTLIVLLIRSLQGLHEYFPDVPQIPLSFNLHGLFEQPPLSYVDTWMRGSEIYFLVVGLSFFAASRISFSLWAFMILLQFFNMGLGTLEIELTNAYRRDLNLGALIAFLGMILWTGRHYYCLVLGRMVGLVRNRDTGHESGILSDLSAGWLTLVGIVISVVWLDYVAMSLGGALMLVLGLLAVWIVMANVVAHSGIPTAYTLSGPREWSLWVFQNADPVKHYSVTDVGNQFMMQKVGGMWAYASDQLGVYATHAEKLVHETQIRPKFRFFTVIVLSLVVGFVVAQVSTLFIYYRFSSTLDEQAIAPLNKEVVEGQPYWTMNHTLRTHTEGLKKESLTWESAARTTAAAVFTGLLAFLQLTYNVWPLHPIGFLMVFSFSMKRIWFSIFLGWLMKALVIRLGGGRLLQAARPVVLGLIMGDVLASGGFGLVAILLNLLGIEYQTIRFMPVSQF